MYFLHKPWHFACLITTLLFTVGCKDEHAELGQVAPPIAVVTLDGTQLSLKEFSGKPLLLTFWSQNCGMCAKELYHFGELLEANGEALNILAVNVDNQPDQLKKFLAKESLPFVVGLDQMKITSERYNLIGTPTSYYIDEAGKIRAKFEKIIPDNTLEKIFKGEYDE